ncbi:beta-glucosidase [Consotaella aegiceratis]|uniref:beta-glucosidase n=1 Tax=Consotaella aegiceratis TaxID=3097961 RepID=UPI002F42C56C
MPNDTIASAEIETLLDAMTLDEQVSLLSGEDSWSLPAIERLNIGKLRVTDGPNGARGFGSVFGGVKSACFPAGIALGATWNVELVEEVGAALANQARAKGAHMLLAPTVNIHRSVTNGRNFECYSEDPILTAELATAYIRGLQANGIGATVKHFVGNESEIERATISSVIDERALREIYLIPFEWAVKAAGSWGIMTSYNRLDGTYTSEHPWLLGEVLHGDWAYDGVAMSDWFGSHSTAPTVNAGLDLEMPGPTRDRGAKLVEAVKAGAVSDATIRARARAVLTVMARTGALHDLEQREERTEDRPQDRELIRRAGAEACVLLKNEALLPLSGGVTVAVIGPNAKTAQIMGGGSAQLNPIHRVSPWDGLVAALGEPRLRYAPGCTNHRWEPLLTGRLRVDYFANTDCSGEPVYSETAAEALAFFTDAIAGGKVDPDRFSVRLTATYTPDASGAYRVGLAAAGYAKAYVDGVLVADAATGWRRGRTFFEEGCDEVVGIVEMEAGRAYEMVMEFATKDHVIHNIAAYRLGVGLPMDEEAIAEAAAQAAACDVAIVCVGRNGEWDTEGSDLDDIALPGRQDALVAAVARANPKTVVVLQTGGPVEMPWLDGVAAVLEAWYPGQEAGHAIADVLTGKAEPSGRLPQSFPARWADNPTHTDDPKVYPGEDGEVVYGEGLFIGYRHYDRAGIQPLFPFGFGLGYARFELSDLAVDAGRFESDGAVSVALDVTNTSERAGACVVQLYVAPDSPTVERPEKELKAFAKVALDPGQSKTVRLALDARAFAYFDGGARQWVVEPGRYAIRLGTDAATLPLSKTISRTTRIELKP